MTTISLTPLDAGLRVRIDEEQWRDLYAAWPEPPALPAWCLPLKPDQLPAAPAAAADTPPAADAAGPADTAYPRASGAGADPDLSATEPDRADEALSEALALIGRPLVYVEVCSNVGRDGVVLGMWTDGVLATSIVRRVDVDARRTGADAVRPIPGLQISALPIGRVLDEAMSAVPPLPPGAAAAAYRIPEELSVALGQALRRNDRAMIEAILGDLGESTVPPIIDDLVRTLDGQVVITVQSASVPETSVGTWLRVRGAWVELRRTADAFIEHVPVSREGLRAILLDSLTGRLGAEIDRATGAAGGRS